MRAIRSPAKQTGRSSAFGAAMVVGTIGTLYIMREILIPLAFALTFTFLLTPVVAFLERLRLHRVPAVIFSLILSIAIAGNVAWIIGNQLLDVVNQLPVYRENIHEKIQALRWPQKGPLARASASLKEIGQELSTAGSPAQVGAAPGTLPTERRATPTAAHPLPVQVVQGPGNSFTYFRDLIGPFQKPLALAGVILILTIFMLVEREDLRNRLLRLVGLTQLNVMTQALDDAAKRVSRYLLMQFLVNASFALVISTALYFIGVPTPLLWGVLAGILRIIPYLGTIVAASLPLLLSLAVFNGWHAPVLVFVTFAVVELLVDNFLEPWLYGSHTGVSALALLVTTIFWTILWGPAGLVLSTPLTVCVVVLGRYVPELSFLHILLGDEPVLAAEAQLYQRLLAMDQQEARTVVDLFLQARPLIELYDDVFIPALNMAEQDRHRGAIDSTREEFFFLSVNDMIAEFADYQAPASAVLDDSQEVPPPVRMETDRRVLCLPAHDQADEIGATMLAQILEQTGYNTQVASLGQPVHEALAPADLSAKDVVCISALPPYALAPARAMFKQLKSRFPRLTVFVCLWGFAGDPEKAKARFERVQPEQLLTNIKSTVEAMRNLDRPANAGGVEGIANDLGSAPAERPVLT